MSRPGDVEFFSSDPAAGTEEDLAEPRQRQVPRWVLGLACLLAVVTASATLVARSGHRTIAGTAVEPSIAPRRLPNTFPTSPPGLGRTLNLGDEPVFDVLTTSDRLYALQRSHLSVLVGGKRTTVPLHDLSPERAASAQLVFDASAERLWVVTTSEDDLLGQIQEFDPLTLRRLRVIDAQLPISQAAALDDHLYVATPMGLFDLAYPANRLKSIAGLAANIVSLVAEPSRHRVLMLAFPPDAQAAGLDMRVYEVPVDGTVHGTKGAVPFGKGTLAVTLDGRIWAAGYGSSGAVLVQLDAATLRPTAVSSLAALLGPGAVLTASGEFDVWVRSGGGGHDLWCLDGPSGAVLQHWPVVTGPVTSRAGRAFAVNGSSAVALRLDACAG